MARLIDADAFLKDILTAGIGKTIIEYSESDIAYMIRKRPTVDAVEVVRCRECKYHRDTSITEYEHCCLIDKTVRYNDFCSYGEREEGAY